MPNYKEEDWKNNSNNASEITKKSENGIINIKLSNKKTTKKNKKKFC